MGLELEFEFESCGHLTTSLNSRIIGEQFFTTKLTNILIPDPNDIFTPKLLPSTLSKESSLNCHFNTL